MKILRAAVAASLAFVSFGEMAGAAPVVGVGLKSVVEELRLVEHAHGVHRYCAVDKDGAHFHVRGIRVSCRPNRRI